MTNSIDPIIVHVIFIGHKYTYQTRFKQCTYMKIININCILIIKILNYNHILFINQYINTYLYIILYLYLLQVIKIINKSYKK